MISVVIPTLNADARLGECLDALVTAALDGVVKEVIVVDGGSSDDTLKIADGFGARIVTAPPGRGGQLKAGAAVARGDWLLFLHADTVLEEGWVKEAVELIEKDIYPAAVFALGFDAKGMAPKLVAFGARMRTLWAKAPYGDQGLLIGKKAYEDIGGFKDIPLFEDVEIMNRLNREKAPHSFLMLSSKAITSAERYERDGYLRRVFKNFILYTRYCLGASPEELAKAYR